MAQIRFDIDSARVCFWSWFIDVMSDVVSTIYIT